MVSTSRPSMSAARKQHELTGFPSTSTVHAPHTCTSQDCLVPVRPSRSRRKSSSSSSAGTSPENGVPLMVADTRIVRSAIGALQHAAPVLPVFLGELLLVLARGQP